MWNTWKQSLRRFFGEARKSRRVDFSARLQVEQLETRIAPAIITVNTKDDKKQMDNFLSLREAIELANGTLNYNKGLSDAEKAQVNLKSPLGTGDTINFYIANQKTQIDLKSALPAILVPITIDGTPPAEVPAVPAKPGKPGKPAKPALPKQVIIIDGTTAGKNVSGFVFTKDATRTAGGSTIKGLTIQKFNANGIELNDVASVMVGGPNPTDRNIIIFNGKNGIRISGSHAFVNNVVGNYIGTDGNSAQPNTEDGVLIDNGASSNEIGDGKIEHRNVISGNRGSGIELTGGSFKTIVNGNYIGTSAAGLKRVGNSGYGLLIRNSSENTIGSPRTYANMVLSDPANIISGNTLFGLRIDADQGGVTQVNTVMGNFIGTDKSGATAIPNLAGISLSGPRVINTTIGGDKPEMLNVISGSKTEMNAGVPDYGWGIYVFSTTKTTIKYNNIGLGNDRNNKVNLKNEGDGIVVLGKAQNLVIKENLIAFNGGNGIKDSDKQAKKMDPNLIFDNSGLGIDDGASAASPTLTSAIKTGNSIEIQGYFDSAANAAFVLEFFGNQVASAADSEGEFFLGNASVTTDSSGHGTFDVIFNAVYGNSVTATFTNTAPDGYTSNFSAAVSLANGGTGNAVVSGRVWNDSNLNGIQDAGETGHSGVTVNLYSASGSLVSSTTTATDGSYTFSGVTPGSYYLQFVSPSGYIFSPPYQSDLLFDSDADPVNGETALFTLSAGEVNPYYDAGIGLPGSALSLSLPPEISGLSVTSGTTSGGNLATISGNNFDGVTRILFGGVPVRDYTVASATTIYAVVPAQAAGTVDVKVFTAVSASQSATATQYSYTNASAPTISSIASSSVSTSGGANVVITGTNLRGTTAISFGTVAATSFRVIDDSTLVAVAPPHASGSVSLTITTYSGSVTGGSLTYSAASAPTVSGQKRCQEPFPQFYAMNVWKRAGDRTVGNGSDSFSDPVGNQASNSGYLYKLPERK